MIAFDEKKELRVPYFDLFSGEYLGKSILLSQDFFNQPLRRDLVHKAYEYYLKYDWKVEFPSKTKGTVP